MRYLILCLLCLCIFSACMRGVVYQGVGVSASSPERAEELAKKHIFLALEGEYCPQTSVATVDGVFSYRLTYNIFGRVYVAKYILKQSNIIKVECVEKKQ